MMIAANINGDSIEPRPWVCLDPAQVSKQAEKHFLRRVLRVFNSAQQPVRSPKDERLVSRDQFLENLPSVAFPRDGQCQFSGHYTREYVNEERFVENENEPIM